MNGVSIVTIIYCERENIKPLSKRLRKALACVEHEIIAIDDLSPDGTYEVERARRQSDPGEKG